MKAIKSLLTDVLSAIFINLWVSGMFLNITKQFTIEKALGLTPVIIIASVIYGLVNLAGSKIAIQSNGGKAIFFIPATCFISLGFAAGGEGDMSLIVCGAGLFLAAISKIMKLRKQSLIAGKNGN